MNDPDLLTDAMIADAMQRAYGRGCDPGARRCYDLASDLESARATCTPRGRCLIGWIVADAERQEWEVWLDVRTGEGRFRKQADAR